MRKVFLVRAFAQGVAQAAVVSIDEPMQARLRSVLATLKGDSRIASVAISADVGECTFVEKLLSKDEFDDEVIEDIEDGKVVQITHEPDPRSYVPAPISGRCYLAASANGLSWNCATYKTDMIRWMEVGL